MKDVEVHQFQGKTNLIELLCVGMEADASCEQYIRHTLMQITYKLILIPCMQGVKKSKESFTRLGLNTMNESNSHQISLGLSEILRVNRRRNARSASAEAAE